MPTILNQSATSKKLLKLEAKQVYLQRQDNRLKSLERKQETRTKIQLGGLIKKAGLHQELPSVIYGLLLEAKEKLQSAEAEIIKAHWKVKGDSL